MDTTPRIYRPERTALVFLDPYNDFLAEDGKLWPRLAEVAEATDLRANLKAVLAAVRATGIPVVIAPHHRSRPGARLLDQALTLARQNKNDQKKSRPVQTRPDQNETRIAWSTITFA